MSGDMIRFISFDFILRIRFRGVMCIAFVSEVPGMHFDDRAGNSPRLGVPAYFIACFKFYCHNEISLSIVFSRFSGSLQGLQSPFYGLIAQWATQQPLQ